MTKRRINVRRSLRKHEKDLFIKRIKMYAKIFVGKPQRINIFRYEEGYLARITYKMSHQYNSQKYYMHHYICFNDYSDVRDFYVMVERGLLKKFEKKFIANSVTRSKINFLNAITHDYIHEFKRNTPAQHFIMFPCALKLIKEYVFPEPKYMDSIIGASYPVKSCII